jgi:hypothetical protein
MIQILKFCALYVLLPGHLLPMQPRPEYARRAFGFRCIDEDGKSIPIPLTQLQRQAKKITISCSGNIQMHRSHSPCLLRPSGHLLSPIGNSEGAIASFFFFLLELRHFAVNSGPLPCKELVLRILSALRE